MPVHPHISRWRVDPGLDIKRIGDGVAPLVALEARGQERGRWDLVDDHDWALWTGGMVLLVSRDAARLVNREGGELLVSLSGSRGVPLLPEDLPESPLRMAVLRCSGRPLLPRLVLHSERRSIVVRGTMGKIVARGWLEDWRAPAGRPSHCELGLSPLRGYEDETECVCRLLDRLVVRCVPGSALFASLESRGVHPAIPEADVQLRDVLAAGPCLQDGISRLLANCWHNEEGVTAGIDPECLHHYRVSLRRARVLAGEARGLPGVAAAAELAGHLQAIAERTGVLRDLDVQLADRALYASFVPGDGGNECAQGFMDFLATRRRRRLGLLRRYLHSAAHVRRRERIGLLLSAESWSAPPIATHEFLADRFQHRLVRLVEACRGVPPVAMDKQLHGVRVQVKKLRYLLAGCRLLLGRAALASWLAGLSRLQGALGQVHDLAVGVEWLSAYRAELDGSPRTEAIDAMERAAVERLADSMADAARRLGGFLDGCRRLGPFPLLVEENDAP